MQKDLETPESLGAPLTMLYTRASGTIATAASLASCGGGGGSGAGDGSTPAGAPRAAVTAADASRLLAQAAFGGSRADIAAVQSLGVAGWIEDQFVKPRSQSHFDWLVTQGYNSETYRTSTAGLDNTLWRKLLSSPDPLRQRVTLALSELLVASVLGVSTLFRLTYRGNAKAPPTGAQPDENYARELMQLFTIGLLELNADGTMQPGSHETYTQADVSGLARVWTGWDLDFPRPIRPTFTDAPWCRWVRGTTATPRPS